MKLLLLKVFFIAFALSTLCYDYNLIELNKLYTYKIDGIQMSYYKLKFDNEITSKYEFVVDSQILIQDNSNLKENFSPIILISPVTFA